MIGYCEIVLSIYCVIYLYNYYVYLARIKTLKQSIEHYLYVDVISENIFIVI